MNFFLNRYKQLLGENFQGLEKVSIKTCIRINSLKISDEDLTKRLNKQAVQLTKVDFLKTGYYVEKSDFSMGSTPEHLFGYYYIQESASQFAVQVLRPSAGEQVLDMAAAPGGKTTQMAEYMQNKGVVVALDILNLRLNSLKNNLERLGVNNALVYKKDARFVSDFGLMFDKILLDAPCSGNFIANKDWFMNRDLAGIKEKTRLQKELLKSAMMVLKPGGTLVYSTCSLEPEENELNIDWFLNKYREKIDLEKIEGPGQAAYTEVFGQELDARVARCRRFWPHLSNTQGFFVAKLVKKH